MMFSKKLLATSISAIVLAGCGVSDQDSGASGNSSQLKGLVVDPYIAHAKVFVDLNNNGIHEFGQNEDFAFTDKDGYFSESKPDSGGNVVDYCADKTAETYKHCLKTAQLNDGAVLRIEGGYDVASGQPFTGSMVVDLNLNGSSQDLGAANPLTSLFASATEAQKAAILTFIGATEEELNQDFLSGDSFDSERFRRAMQVHKAVAIMSNVLDVRYSLEAGKKVNDKQIPATSGKYVYESVAELLSNTSTPAVPSTTYWRDTLASAESKLAADLGFATKLSTTEKASVGARVANLFGWFETNKSAIAEISPGASDSQESLFKYARVADFAVGQIKREVKNGFVSGDNTVMNNVLDATGSGQTFDIVNFGKDVDLDQLIKATSAPSTMPKFSTGAELFSETRTLAGQMLEMTYADSSDDSKTGTAQMYFSGLSSTVNTEGSVALCVKATGDDSDLNDLDDIKTGVSISGNWTRLNDYSVNVILDLPGVPEQPLIVKRTVFVDGADDTFQFALDANGDLEEWKGSLTDFNSAAPNTNAACQSALTN